FECVRFMSFFFSSRRRHTRLVSDWSSDVCSSDLMAVSGGHTPWQMLRALANEAVPWEFVHVVQVDERIAPAGDPDRNLTHLRERSEERRVGKGGGFRWGTEYCKKTRSGRMRRATY